MKIEKELQEMVYKLFWTLLKYHKVVFPTITSSAEIYIFKNNNKYELQKGTVVNMNTPKFILHTNSTFIKDGVSIEEAKDIISLIDYFNLSKEKYHFDILTIDGYIDCFDLFVECIGTTYEETLLSMLIEYQRYIKGDVEND